MSANIPAPRTFVYKTDENGCEVACDVYVPENISNPCAMIIWMHYSGLVFENRHAVGTHMFYSGPRRGFVVVNIDYRLAPQAKMEDIYQDVEDCARWCRQVLPTKLGNGIVDPEKLIIGGGSCGELASPFTMIIKCD
jgi:acetyl esterase/lipase